MWEGRPLCSYMSREYSKDMTRKSHHFQYFLFFQFWLSDRILIRSDNLISILISSRVVVMKYIGITCTAISWKEIIWLKVQFRCQGY